MQCKKCGQENMDGAPRCQRCGAPLAQVEQSASSVPMWFGSRIIGVLAAIAGVLVIVGVFVPWATAKWSSGQPLEAHSATGTGWELMTASGDIQDGAEPYAIMAFAGSIVLLLGAAWAFLDPGSKFAWAMTFVGGALAIAGSVWAWQVLNGIVFVGVNAAETTIDHGAGLDLTLGGGIAAIIASVIGRLGASESRPRL